MYWVYFSFFTLLLEKVKVCADPGVAHNQRIASEWLVSLNNKTRHG
jgi:hypothetical protein